ncbi:hypothetical protein Taro_035206 [Colocasia esculenta]|uniref:Uncharacterized protein n=1 Tax=Colocasia esculenta TaxID=4460 RepID=A0A843VZU1_COLES|nr:hypothetical protein [Colocasia esculenta]
MLCHWLWLVYSDSLVEVLPVGVCLGSGTVVVVDLWWCLVVVDTAEHWVHEIERVFTTMRSPTADRVVLAAYQLRGFALEW